LWAALHLRSLRRTRKLFVHWRILWVSLRERLINTEIIWHFKIVYKMINISAYCKQPCVFGNCTSPGICTCNHGYSGLTCEGGIGLKCFNWNFVYRVWCQLFLLVLMHHKMFDVISFNIFYASKPAKFVGLRYYISHYAL